MAAQKRLDRDARTRRRNQRAGAARSVPEPGGVLPIRTCANCYACSDGISPASGHCVFFGVPTRRSNRAAAIGCLEHRYNEEVTR